jgi:integrase
VPNDKGSRRGNGEGHYWTRLHPADHPRAGRIKLHGWRRTVAGVRYQATATSQRALRARVDLLQQQIAEGDAPDPGSGRTTVAAYARNWLATLDKTPRTLASYTNFVATHLEPGLGDRLLRDVSAPLIRGFLATQRAKGLAPTTLALHATLLAMILNQASAEQFPVPKAALRAIKRPTLKQGGKPALIPEQVDQLLALEGDPLTALWAILIFAGLRISEGLGLRWSDFRDPGTWRVIDLVRQLDPDASLASYTFPDLKSDRSRRTIVLPPRAAAHLARHHEVQQFERRRAGPDWVDEGLVICSPVGTPVLQSYADRAFKESCRRAELPLTLTPHACRRTYGDLLRLAGLDLRTIADLMGHANTATTAGHYMSVLHPLALRAADGLEALFQ